jgi:hypothetical protein
MRDLRNVLRETRMPVNLSAITDARWMGLTRQPGAHLREIRIEAALQSRIGTRRTDGMFDLGEGARLEPPRPSRDRSDGMDEKAAAMAVLMPQRFFRRVARRGLRTP